MINVEGVVSLTDKDWDMLLPGEPFKIGQTTLVIKPLGLIQVKEAVRQIREVLGEIEERGITKTNYKELQHITFLAECILEKAPELLTASAGLHMEDIQRLPLAILIELVTKVLQVNIESQDGLIKNLKALADKVKELTPTGGLETSVTS